MLDGDVCGAEHRDEWYVESFTIQNDERANFQKKIVVAIILYIYLVACSGCGMPV